MADQPILRLAGDGDWSRLLPTWRAVVDAGETYTYDPNMPDDAGRAAWLAPPPNQTWLATDGDEVLGTYQLHPNQPGLGSHVANASFMVAPGARGRGIGRLLGEHCLAQARERGFAAMQFNAVVATNTAAIHLWESLGLRIVGTVPKGFRHRRLGLVDFHVMHRFL